MGSISQVTLEVPSALASSLKYAAMVWTRRRGGSTSRISPSPRMRLRLGGGHLEVGAGLQLGDDHGRAEVVLAPDLGIDDRLPQALGGGADVDLEDLLHRALQSLFEVAEPRGPGLGVLAHPPVVDEPDRDRVQEMELLAASSPGDHEARLLELLQVLHHAEPRDVEPRLERAQRLAVFTEQLVEQAPPGGIGEGPEHFVHLDDNR